MTEKRRPRTALLSLRTPWAFKQGSETPKPGDNGLLDATQLRAMKRAIRQARTGGRLTVKDADIELEQIKKGLEIIEKGPLRDVGVHFPIDACIQPRQMDSASRRQRNKAARKARKAQRRKKKR